MTVIILYTSYIILSIALSIALISLLFVVFELYKLKKLDLNLKKYNLILICDCEDYSSKLYRVIRFFNFNIFDMNDDIIIINHLINNSSTDILLDTNGGYISSNDRLVNFILNSDLRIKIYVMRKAYSAGTILALSAEHLYMDKNACLGTTDPQITILKDTISIKSLMNLCEEKDKNTISDIYLIQYYEYKRSHEENIKLITKLLNKKFNPKISKKDQLTLIDKFTSGNMSHHIPISYNYLIKYIKINNNMPIYIKNIYVMYYNIFYLYFYTLEDLK